MSTTIAINRGSGEVSCECSNHRDRCRFGRPHDWATPWFDESGVLKHTWRCIPCGSECTAKG